jgi:hypothetical protein
MRWSYDIAPEVKSRSDYSTLHRWLEGADALVLRADRRAHSSSCGYLLRRRSPSADFSHFVFVILSATIFALYFVLSRHVFTVARKNGNKTLCRHKKEPQTKERPEQSSFKVLRRCAVENKQLFRGGQRDRRRLANGLRPVYLWSWLRLHECSAGREQGSSVLLFDDGIDLGRRHNRPIQALRHSHGRSGHPSG